MFRGPRHGGLAGALAGAVGLALVVMTASPASAADEVVHKGLTTSDLSQHLTQQSSLGFSATSGSGTISVDDTQTFQSIVGLGAAMTGSSAWLLSTKLTGTARTNLMNALFSPSQGIGIAGKCLDANGRGPANGTEAILWTCGSQANQQWKLRTLR